MDLSPYSPESSVKSLSSSVPRVGGGYATRYQVGTYAWKYGAGNNRGEGVKQLPEPRNERSGNFDGYGVRHVVVVQGGASVWTAEEDGSLAVRSAESGMSRHRIERPSGDLSEISVMHAHGNHIWVGTSDGNIEVYEHLLAALLTTTKGQHALNVIAFSPTSASHHTPSTVMFSLSPEKLNKWGNEAETFCLLRSFDLSQSGNTATSVTCSPDGKHVYIGAANGTITLCTGELAPLGSWPAHPGASVSSLYYDANVVMSGGTDGGMKVWEGRGEGGALIFHEEDQHHEGALRFIAREGDSADTLSSMYWTNGILGGGAAMHDPSFIVVTCDEGNLRRWRWDGAELLLMTVESAPGLLSLSSFSCWRGMRLLSFGSNGKMVPWFTARNVACDAMDRTAAEMRLIIEQDNTELQKWRDLISDVENMDRHRLACGLQFYRAHNLDQNNLLFRYYRKLYGFMRYRKNARHARRVRRTLMLHNQKPLMARYFYTLKRWAELCRRQRHNTHAAEHLLRTTDEGQRRLTWMRWARFANIHARNKRKQDIADLLQRNTSQGLMYLYYKKLYELKQTRRMQVKSQQAAARLAAVTNKDFIMKFYYRWLAMQQERYYASRGAVQSILLMSNHLRSLQKRYYDKLYYAAVDKKMQRIYGSNLSILLCTHRQGGKRYDEVQRNHCFTKWREWTSRRRQANLTRDTGKAQAEKDRLIAEQEKYKYPELHKKEREMSERLDTLAAKRQELDRLLAALRQKNDAVEEKLRKQQAIEKSISEQFHDIMAKLKELSLNFEQDRDLIVKTTERAKASAPYKVFLEAHMEIKAVVVRVSGKSRLGKSDLWPMKQILPRLQPHELRNLYTGVKMMVVAFDLLKVSDLNMLETDDEIVLNGKNLIQLYKLAEKSRVSRR
eukprot:TRINITY_DN4694_c0_g1_i1.p1 TRINITY_DN4694_c0_g1~~TRINITY_DN4694_c0_g1_i1.p1  ORF type:complete len:943 (+),score=380.87 TRINITY_DN4694_c0_g1_i1:137-2830(+)